MPLVIWGHFKSTLESIQTSLYCNATVTFCSLILFIKSCLIDWSKTKKSFPHWASCDTTPTYLSIYRHQDLDKICLSLVFFFLSHIWFGFVHWRHGPLMKGPELRKICLCLYLYLHGDRAAASSPKTPVVRPSIAVAAICHINEFGVTRGNQSLEVSHLDQPVSIALLYKNPQQTATGCDLCVWSRAAQ